MTEFSRSSMNSAGYAQSHLGEVTKFRSPDYSFGTSLRSSHVNQSTSICQYVNDAKIIGERTKLKRPPSFSATRSPRFANTYSVSTPGPDQYKPNLSWDKQVTKSSYHTHFGSHSRSQTPRLGSPGVGTYNVGKSRDSTLSHLPSFSVPKGQSHSGTTSSQLSPHSYSPYPISSFNRVFRPSTSGFVHRKRHPEH